MQQLQNSINNLYLSDTLNNYHILTECVKHREFAIYITEHYNEFSEKIKYFCTIYY